MGSKKRYFDFYFSIPLIVCAIATSCIDFRARKNISVNIGESILSLDPRRADDWSSFFVINHIYPRFESKFGEFKSNAVISKKTISCKENGLTVLSNDCKTLRVDFTLKSNLKSCSNLDYNLHDFRTELEQLANTKKWLLPNFNWCTDSPTCFEISNLPNINEHFDSIYLRFGWSKTSDTQQSIGMFPNCFKPSKRNDLGIADGKIETERFNIHLSTSNESPDIFLYESSSKDSNFTNIDFYNPVYYFLVIRDERNLLSQNDFNVIQKRFLDSGIISQSSTLDILDSSFSHGSSSNQLTKLKSLQIPNYLVDCSQLANELSKKVPLKFDCANISEYIEKDVKKGSSWDAFISPLTPGLPGREALKTQYFSNTSDDNWISRDPKIKSKVYLLGKSEGKITVKRNTFCSIKPNSLGLSNLTIDDFSECSN